MRFGRGELERPLQAPVGNVERSRKEPGCEACSYAVHLTEPGLLRITEMSRDEAALDAHMKRIPGLMGSFESANIEAVSITACGACFLKNVAGE